MTGRASLRWHRPRTSSASTTTTRAPTPAAWGRTRPCRWSTTGSSTGSSTRPSSRSSARCAAGGHRLPGRALRRAHPHRRRARVSSSTTCASATPRPRSCCPGSPRTSPACWPRPPRVGCAPSRASRPTPRCAWCWPREGYPTAPAHRRPHRRARGGRRDRGGHACFHAGTALDDEGCVRHRRRARPRRERRRAAPSPTPGRRAYAAVDRIGWEGMQYRTDIAADAAAAMGRCRRRTGGAA